MKKAGRKPSPAIERVFSSIKVHPLGCWEYTGTIIGAGYGRVGEGPRGAHKFHLVHRLVYETEVGPIPEGLQIDHLCCNKRCCNPAHLEPVSPQENVRRAWEKPWIVEEARERKAHCSNGHPYVEGSFFRPVRGGRVCKTCANERRRRYRERLARG